MFGSVSGFMAQAMMGLLAAKLWRGFPGTTAAPVVISEIIPAIVGAL